MACSCILLALCTAGVEWAKYRGASPAPEPSVPGGYYEDAFVLYLKAPPFGKIYYTTDGSAPSADSLLYQDGISIVNRSGEPNVYHAIRNVVKDWENYTPNPAPVEKGTVIRAVYINDWGAASEILTQTYFVGIAPPERGCTLSLVFSHEDLFGEEGIYVTGREYDEWYRGGRSGQEPEANFETHMEVPVIAELLDASGDILNQPVGLRIQGASAREAWNKRFIVTAREKYGGSSVFDTVLFEGVTTHSVMIKDALPDAIAADLVADRAVAVQRSIPVRVFLNGEFWYSSYLLERYDTHYFQQYYQVNDRVLIKNGMVEDHSDWDAEQYCYSEFMRWVNRTDFSDNDNWTAFQAQTDVQSFIDYMAVNYFLCNRDFSDRHNYVVWHESSLSNRGTDRSRWQWCLYDVDALEWYDAERYGLPERLNLFSMEKGINDTAIFRALKQNPQFRQWFVLSFLDICNNHFAPEKVEKVLEAYGCTLDWQGGYFRKRPAYALEHIAEEFELTGTPETVTICTANPEMGSVVVNTSQIDLTSGSWSGQYFTDYPITVTASAKEGYRFAGWKGDADTAETTLHMPVDGGIRLEAVFAKEQ